MVVYGIPNCNTVKKALDWLKANKIAYEFHDFKKSGISETKLKAWSKQVGWQKLVNRKGTTWKLLDASIQQSVTTEKAAIALMQEKTSVIKRPVLETETDILLGFDETLYSQKFL
jgi:Spx/MgsR family transcriptional regulator